MIASLDRNLSSTEHPRSVEGGGAGALRRQGARPNARQRYNSSTTAATVTTASKASGSIRNPRSRRSTRCSRLGRWTSLMIHLACELRAMATVPKNRNVARRSRAMPPRTDGAPARQVVPATRAPCIRRSHPENTGSGIGLQLGGALASSATSEQTHTRHSAPAPVRRCPTAPHRRSARTRRAAPRCAPPPPGRILLGRQRLRQMAQRTVPDEHRRTSVQQVGERRQHDARIVASRAMQERIPHGRFVGRVILHAVLDAQLESRPYRVVQGRGHRLRADVHDDAEFVAAGRVDGSAVLHVARGDLQHDRIGGLAQRGPVEHCTIGTARDAFQPGEIPVAGGCRRRNWCGSI